MIGAGRSDAKLAVRALRSGKQKTACCVRSGMCSERLLGTCGDGSPRSREEALNSFGTICAVAHSGNTVGDQWPASRPIAAEKANKANGTSLPNFAISTANLCAQSQPGAISAAL